MGLSSVCQRALTSDNLVLTWLALRIRGNATKYIQNNMQGNVNTCKFPDTAVDNNLLFNTYSMKQPDLYYFETIQMTSQA